MDGSNDLRAKVIEIIAEQMGVDRAEITLDTSFINDLNTDSLDQVELLMEFEDTFHCSITDEDAARIRTVGDAIEFIERWRGDGDAGVPARLRPRR